MVNGCHLKTIHKLILLVAVRVDGNGSIMPLAWAVVWSETKANWIRFLQDLRDALNIGEPEQHIDNAVFLSDRQKGLIPAVIHVLPGAEHYYCVHHLYTNVQQEYGKVAGLLFKKLANAETAQEYRDGMEKIKASGIKGLENYVQNIPPDRYAFFACTSSRFGHFTSNLAESINSAWLYQRELPILQCFKSIWEYIASLCFTRREETTFKNPRFTNYAYDLFSNEAHYSGFYIVQKIEGAPTYIASVYNPTSGRQFTVTLSKNHCTCLHFQDLKIPCQHAIAVAREFGLDAEDFIDDAYTVQTFRDTYYNKITPEDAGDDETPSVLVAKCLDLEGLKKHKIYPPPVNRTAGRPQQARRQRGKRTGHNKRQYACSKCGAVSHRAGECTTVEAGQGRSNLPLTAQSSSSVN